MNKRTYYPNAGVHRYSAGGIAASTLSGAAAGAPIAPPWGAIAGAAIGLGKGIYDHSMEKKADAHAEWLNKKVADDARREYDRQRTIIDSDYLNSYKNATTNSFMAVGGGVPVGAGGVQGAIQQLTSDGAVVNGAPHELGGVKAGSMEVEGNENIRANPVTGKIEVDSARLGTAQANRPLMLKKAMLEGQKERLRAKKQALSKQKQESSDVIKTNELNRDLDFVDGEIVKLEKEIQSVQQAIQENFQKQEQFKATPEGQQAVQQIEQGIEQRKNMLATRGEGRGQGMMPPPSPTGVLNNSMAVGGVDDEEGLYYGWGARSEQPAEDMSMYYDNLQVNSPTAVYPYYNNMSMYGREGYGLTPKKVILGQGDTDIATMLANDNSSRINSPDATYSHYTNMSQSGREGFKLTPKKALLGQGTTNIVTMLAADKAQRVADAQPIATESITTTRIPVSTVNKAGQAQTIQPRSAEVLPISNISTTNITKYPTDTKEAPTYKMPIVDAQTFGTAAGYGAALLKNIADRQRNDKLAKMKIPEPQLNVIPSYDTNINVHGQLNAIDRGVSRYRNRLAENTGDYTDEARMRDLITTTADSKAKILAARDNQVRQAINDRNRQQATIANYNTGILNRYKQAVFNKDIKTQISNPAKLDSDIMNATSSVITDTLKNKYQNDQVMMTAYSRPEAIPAMLENGVINKSYFAGTGGKEKLDALIKTLSLYKGSKYKTSINTLQKIRNQLYGAAKDE